MNGMISPFSAGLVILCVHPVTPLFRNGAAGGRANGLIGQIVAGIE